MPNLFGIHEQIQEASYGDIHIDISSNFNKTEQMEHWL